MYKPLDITTCPAAFCFYSSTLSSGGAPPESTSLKASRFASDSVRRPIGFRPPPDRIPSAVRSDSVRRPVGYLEKQPAKYRAFALILLNI